MLAIALAALLVAAAIVEAAVSDVPTPGFGRGRGMRRRQSRRSVGDDGRATP